MALRFCHFRHNRQLLLKAVYNRIDELISHWWCDVRMILKTTSSLKEEEQQ